MKLHKLGAGCVVAAASLSYVVAQTQIDLRTQAKRVDFSNSSSTKPSKTGIVLPALCAVGETFLKLDAKPGANLYVCTAANVWTVQGNPLPDYVVGSYGKILTNDDAGMGWESLGGDVAGAPDALAVTGLQGRPVAQAAPSSGHVLGWDGTQWSPQPVPMPVLTGDVTTSVGGTVTTLSSVNGAPGTCGDETHVCQLTTNAKGLVTQQTPVAVSGGGGGINALNGLSAGNQKFVNDSNVTISSAGSDHTLGWNGVLGLARGGLSADLSKTGGAHQVLQQGSLGVPVTVAPLTSGDIAGLAASATTDATNASNISSGTLPNARLSAVPNTALANSSVTVAAGNGLSGGGAAALGGSVTLNAVMPVNAQIGTSYAVVAGDGGKLVTLNNAAAVGVTLPQATGAFGAGWYVRLRNLGAGATTITPVTSTIDGAASVVLQSGQGVEIASDGTNYQTWRGYTWQSSAAGSHQFATGISGAGVVSYGQPGAADISGLAASATTDATNASNISSGTLGAARLPAALSNSTSVNGTAIPASATLMTTGAVLAAAQEPAHSGDVTNPAGSLTLTAGKINGTSVPVNAAADQTLVTTAAATGGWAGVPNCGDATHALAYSTSTHTYACQAITATATPGGASGQVQYNNGGALSGLTIGGDATLNTGTGALTVTKTNGGNFAASATTDATNASNISSGTLGAGRMPQFTGGQVTSPAAGSAVLNIGAGTVTNAMLSGSIATSKLASVQGTDTNILTAGSVSGTGAPLCTDANGGATTSGCAAGAGTVSVVGSGSLTGSALVTGGGTQTLQTPATTATMDSSGNIQTPGTIQTGYGSSNAGAWAFVQGTATAAPANSVGFQAPDAVTSAYRITLPAAPAAGYVKRTNATPSVESVGVIAAADLPSGLDKVVISGPTVPRTYSLPDANKTLMATDTAVQASQLPNPGASSLGGVQSKDCSGTGHVQRINSDGTVTCSADSGGGSSGWVSAPATVHSQATGTVNNDVTETVTGCAGGTPYYASCQGNACTPTTVTSYSTPVLVAPDSSTKASFLSRCEVAHYDPSSVVRSDLTFQVGAITATPDTGSYSGTQTVTVGGGSTSDYKCYTTDNSDPTGTASSCTNGTHVTTTISIPSTTTLKVRGYKANYAASAIKSATYTVSGSAPSVLGSAFAASLGANGGTTTGISTAGANAIVVALSFAQSAAGSMSLSDTIGGQNNGAPTAGNQTCVSSGSCNQLFWWTNPAHVGSGHQFIVSGTSSWSSIAVIPLTGMVTSGLLDTQGAGSSSSTPCVPGSITPGTGNKVVISSLSTTQVETITPPTGYTSPGGLQFVQAGGTTYGLYVSYLIQTPNGATTNPSWVMSGGSSSCTDAAFKGQ